MWNSFRVLSVVYHHRLGRLTVMISIRSVFRGGVVMERTIISFVEFTFMMVLFQVVMLRFSHSLSHVVVAVSRVDQTSKRRLVVGGGFGHNGRHMGL